ncbi:MAG: hypothetical protein LBL28_07690 [Treponema sp.]|jgi:hypothetical protein|nr:hypothetical protein [Treponema sp.]
MFSKKRGKNLRVVMALLFGIMLAFTLMGCNNSDDSADNPYDGNPYGDEGTGWPSSRLSKYGLGGMSQPAGMSNIEWWEYDGDYPGYDYPVISISFSGTANTDTAIQQYFSGDGWTPSGTSYGGTSAFYYTKGTAAAYYYFDSSSSIGAIVAGYPAD